MNGDGTVEAFVDNTGGVTVLDNNVIVAGNAANNVRGLVVLGASRMFARHNLIVAGDAGQSSTALAVFAQNPAPGRHVVNNVFVAGTSPLAICVSGSTAFERFQNNSLGGCATALFQTTLAPARDLVAIADVNSLLADGFQVDVSGNIVHVPVVADETVLETAGNEALAFVGLDETSLVPLDFDGLVRTAPVSIGPRELGE